MNPIRFRSLSQIFILGVVLICVPLLAGTVLTFVYIKHLSDDNRDMVVRSLEIGRETEKLVNYIEELNRTARQYMVVDNKELFDLYAQKHDRLIDTLEWLEVLVDQKDARALLESIRSISNAVFDQVKLKSTVPGSRIDTGSFAHLAELSDKFRFFSNAAIQHQLDVAARKVSTARAALYWIWGTSSLFVVAFVVIFAWFIARPIRRIDSRIRHLGQGNFEDSIKIHGPADISELGDRLDWLRMRLSEVDQIKERFFREMSHQLKTPLASIREGAGLLLDESGRMESTRQREVLDLVHNSSIELQRMLDNMLSFSAWRADPGKLYKERFRIGLVAAGVAQRFQVSLLTHNIRLGIDCPDELVVEMDREKCRIILDNLISNAVKFSPENGSVGVYISGGGAELLIIVCDEGPGVPESERDKIFDLFYLGESTFDSRHRGTGVGLSLVRAYVEAHGGGVSVESSNYGAKFRVVIPQS
ncbi:MAG: HAMP domain-containing sensor histidine kinase [Arenicellales bacterium]